MMFKTGPEMMHQPGSSPVPAHCGTSTGQMCLCLVCMCAVYDIVA